MDMETLKTFCAVAQYRSFRKAADALQITQPGVSRRIQSLEEEMGTPLFLRTPQSVVLTKQGKDFLPYAERSVKIIDEGTEKVMEGTKEEGLLIGGTPTTSFYYLPRVIKEFSSDHSTRLTVYTAPSEQILDMLLDQTIDLGFTTAAYSNPLVLHERIFSEEIVCVAHPELVKKHVEGGRIIHAPLPVVCKSLNTPLWDEVNKHFLDHPLYHVVTNAQYTTVVDQLARLGVGFAMLPKSEVIQGLRSGELVEAPLPDLVLPKRELYMLTHANKQVKKSVIQFKKVLKRFTRENRS
ncbi:LysR family transcriptional regulator [Brevibacillus centrosporus]|uniref:LysR family transcriptional regulator n=1 Tax=Brevibacillus centrosporus TaxID=54910 RepID=UPI002E1CFCEA|nr:LysR family transcriptional regulator [Brevibacillus centrosporus]